MAVQADAVGAFGEDVEFGGDAGFAEGGVEAGGVLGGDDFVLAGVEEEGGRGIRGDVFIRGHGFDEVGSGGIAEEVFQGTLVGVGLGEGEDAVGEDGEIGFGGEEVYGVGVRV